MILHTRSLVIGLMMFTVGALANGIFDEPIAALWLAGPVTVIAYRLLDRLPWLSTTRWPFRLLPPVIALVIGLLTLGADRIGEALSPAGPSRLFTTEWPSPADPAVIATVTIGLIAAASVAIELAVRPRWHLAALAPVGASAIAAAALSAPAGPTWPELAILGGCAILFAALRHGEPTLIRLQEASRERSLVLTGVATALAATAVVTAIGWPDAQRSDPRRLQEPDATATVLDALESVAAQRVVDPPADLYRIDDLSEVATTGLPSTWRTAALTEYDGQRWVPQAALRPIGGRLVNDVTGQFTYRLTIVGDHTDAVRLVPFPGQPVSVSADVETDVERSVVRLAEFPEPGDTFEVVAGVAPSHTAGDELPIGRRDVGEVSGGFIEQAQLIAGEGTPVEQIRAIEHEMRSEWQLDPEAAGAGLQLRLIENFVTETKRGTEQQFVTAFVLLVRSLGFDARVATGYVTDGGGDTITLRTSDAAVWPEVRIEGAGWARLNPVPEAVFEPEFDEPLAPQEQTPAAPQPPIAPPAEQGDAQPDDGIDNDQVQSDWVSTIGRWARRLAVGAAIGIGPLLLGLGLILAVKALRRRRRESSAEAAARIRGAWANSTDLLVDAGVRIGAAWTNERIASEVSLAADTDSAFSLGALESRATFGALDRSLDDGIDPVMLRREIDRAMARSMSWMERMRWRLNLRSLLPHTRSPVRGR